MQVYKFLPTCFALDDLRKRRLKISTFGDMNDPFEFWGAKHSNLEVQYLLTQYSQLHIGVLCFSRSLSNPLLWSHYADKHNGICLGFEVGAQVEVNEASYVGRQCALDSNVMLEAAAHSEGLEGSSKQAAEKMMRSFLLTKYTDWKYEDEVRIFIRFEECQRDDDFYFAEFNENIQLNAVITGCRCTLPADEVQAVVSQYSRRINLIRAMLSPDSFEVVQDEQG